MKLRSTIVDQNNTNQQKVIVVQILIFLSFRHKKKVLEFVYGHITLKNYSQEFKAFMATFV